MDAAGILVHPGAGILSVLVLFGFYAIVAGASLIAFAFWIRGIQQDTGTTASRLAHST